MKLQPDAVQVATISGYGVGWVMVGTQKYTGSIVISPLAPPFDWNCTNYEALQPSHFEQLATMNAELVLFGSGARIQFPKPEWLESLYCRRIGVETMDTQAACRTYNFLAGEGRKVIAALLL